MFFGNLFVFIKFQGKTHIDLETRNVVFGALTGVCAVGMVFLVLLRPVRRVPAIDDAKVKLSEELFDLLIGVTLFSLPLVTRISRGIDHSEESVAQKSPDIILFEHDHYSVQQCLR